MEIKDIKAVYFVGAGGIGMSAIARYFISRGLVVAGYDKTPSDLTRQLEKEGMLIHYEENIDAIPAACKQPESCLIIYTPAIPAEHQELQFFRQHGFEIQKRAQVLGTLTREHKGLCVAGTHGKTTTSTMCAPSTGCALGCQSLRRPTPTTWISTVRKRPILKVSVITRNSYNLKAH